MLTIILALAYAGASSRVEAARYVTPRLMVTGADMPDKVLAGETFDLVLHLQNESTVSDIVNISLKLSSQDNHIVTASGSDSLFIDKIAKNEEYDLPVKMLTESDLEQKTYSLNITINYENKDQSSFSDTAVISIPVSQEARIGVSEKKLSRSEIYVEGNTSLSMKLNNMGHGKLYNVGVDFSGDSIEEISTFLGTIEAGASSPVDLTITGKQAGEDGITAVIHYEDADGKEDQIKEDIPLTVLEASTEEYVEESTGPSPVLIVVLIVIVIAAILIIRTILRRRREKRYE